MSRTAEEPLPKLAALDWQRSSNWDPPRGAGRECG